MARLTTINAAVPVVTYTASAQTTFAFDFPVEDGSHLVVELDGVVKTSGVDYTVTVAGDNSGATITFTNAVTGTVRISRSTKLALLDRHDPAVASVDKALLQHQLARLTLIAQDLAASSLSVSGSTGGSGAEIPPFKWDGTDETAAFNAWLKQRLVTDGANWLVAKAPDGKAVRIDGTIRIERSKTDPFVVDLSGIRIQAGKKFKLRVNGGEREFPETNTYLLAEDAASGTDKIKVNLSPQNGNHARLEIGAVLVMRGEKDASGNVLDDQKHVSKIIDKSVVDTSTVELTLEDALTADFKVSYPDSAWIEEGGGVNQTHITVIDEIPLSVDHEGRTATVTLTVDPAAYGWASGDWALLQTDKTAGDVQGTSTARIARRPVRIVSIDSTARTVTFDTIVPDVMATEDGARVTRLRTVENGVLRAPSVTYVEDPDPAPAERVPTFEVEGTVGFLLEGARIDDVAQGRASRGQLVRVETSVHTVVRDASRVGRLSDFTNYGSGDGYGVYFVSCRECLLLDAFFTRSRHGVSFSNCWRCAVSRVVFDDCLVNGADTHGAVSREITISDCIFIAGASRASDAANQSGITLGNTANQAGDINVLVTDCLFEGFSDSDGAIEIHTPVSGAFVENCVGMGCDDLVVLKETGSIDGGAVYVDGAKLLECSGYAVDDDTASTKFGRIALGTVLTDGNEAGLHSVGASGQAVRPDLVPNKGVVTTLRKQVTTTPYSTGTADRYLHKSSTSYDVQVTVLEIGNPDATARTVNLHANAAVNDQVMLAVPDGQTGTVTVGLQSGATFQDGATTWQVVPAFGNGIERQATFTCVANSDGSSAVWLAAGDLVPANGYYTLDYPLVGAFGRIGVAGFTTSFTLATSHEGDIFEFTGSSAVTVTLPSTWSGTMGVWPLFNRGSADVTIAGGTSGSVVVPAGEAATIVRGANRWYVMPAGAFTEAT